MATRGNLNKLKINEIKELATDLGIETSTKIKQELISDILNSQVAVSSITPVVLYQSENDAISPKSKENMPPFNRVAYQKGLPSGIKISFSMIYDFMFSRKTETGSAINNFKGMDRAVKHYDAGDVKDISCAQVDNSTIYVKSACQASMRKHEYEVYLCITKRGDATVTIDSAYCQCPVGLAQACSHVGALLFALSNMIVCTSVLCQWKVPRANAKPQPMAVLTQRKPSESVTDTMNEESTPTSQTNFDPRHSTDRAPNLIRTLSHLQRLKEIFPNSGMAHLWNIPDPVPSASHIEEIETTQDPLFIKMEEMLFTEGNLPPPSIDPELVLYIERYTTKQRECEMWRKLHKGRIPSSLFGDVEGLNLEKYTNSPAAVQWGINHEDTVRVKYSMLKQPLYDNFCIDATGLTLCNTHAFLGASSDGRVTEGDAEGVLEIKCPYSIKGTLVNEMEIPDILKKNDKSFCLENTSEGPKLKVSHKYYAQVQGEMVLNSAPWCDFVVWTAAKANNICIDRVYFDSDFVSSMLPKHVQFYMQYVFPVYYGGK